MFDAMLARRTFAASDEIIVKASAGDHMVGKEFAASAGSPLEFRMEITAPDDILRVDLVRDGKYVYTVRPQARRADLSFRETDTAAGNSYYYVRVFQSDTENPLGDPEIAWTSPFFVRYE